MSEDNCGETCKQSTLCYACSKELNENTWQGLTIKDIDDIGVSMVSMDWMAGARWAEAKLREKNT